MLEIILLVFLCKKISETVKEKGRNPVGYVILTVVLWFVGEFAGAFVGAIAAASTGQNAVAFVCGLIGAALGAAISFTIAANVSDIAGKNIAAMEQAQTAAMYGHGSTEPPASAPVVNEPVEDKSEEEKEEDNFAASIGLSALKDEETEETQTPAD